MIKIQIMEFSAFSYEKLCARWIYALSSSLCKDFVHQAVANFNIQQQSLKYRCDVDCIVSKSSQILTPLFL